MSYTINLATTDLETISGGGTVTATTDGVTFELTDEDNYTGPAFSGGVFRIGLDQDRLWHLRNGIERRVISAGVDRIVTFTACSDAAPR